MSCATWHVGKGRVLTLSDTGHTDWRGQTRLAYVFRLRGQVLFEGEDFAGSPLHADDSRETMLALLAFLTLRSGDTDSGYFDSYSPEQMDWSESSECEAMSRDVAMAEETERMPPGWRKGKVGKC